MVTMSVMMMREILETTAEKGWSEGKSFDDVLGQE